MESTNNPVVNPYLNTPSESPISYNQPAFDVLEYQKTPEWYRQNVRYFSSYYNNKKMPFSSFDGSGVGPDSSSSSSSSNLNSPVTRGEADEMRYNFSYYFGEQPNVDFNFVTEDITGGTFQNPWIRGKHAAKLMDFMKGPALKLLTNVKFSAQTLSKEAVSKKGAFFDKIMMQWEMKEHLKEMQAAGAMFSPTNQNFDTMEDMQDFMKDYKDEGEELSANFAMDIYTKNNLKYVYINAWLHSIVGGIGAVYNYVNNGQVKKKHIACDNLIWDCRDDNDFNEKAQFVGFVEFLTPQEIMSKWGEELSVADMETIKALSKKMNGYDGFINYYNSGTNNFNWYSWQANTLTVACVTMFWIGPRDLRYVKIKNREGNTRYRKLNNYTADDILQMRSNAINYPDVNLDTLKPQGNIRSDYKTYDVHKSTLIGNWKLVDSGYNKNTVREWKNKGNPELPVKLFVPNMFKGKTRATMTMLRDNQNEIDRLGHKIREITGKDKGVIPFVDGSMLQAPYNDPQKLADLATDVGLVVINKSNAIDQQNQDRKLVEMVPFTGSIGLIDQYIKLKQEEERIMEEILNLSKVALGQNTNYISQGAQQNVAAYSSMGTAYLFDGFMHMVELDTRYSANVQKMITAVDDEEEMVGFMAGNNGIKWCKVTQERRFEDVLIFLHLNDIIDEQGRQRLLGLTQAWSQNPENGITPLDMLKLEKETTYSGMIRVLEVALKKAEMKAKQAQQYNDAIKMVQAQQTADAQAKQEEMRNNGAMQRTQVQAGTKMAGDMIKADTAKFQPEVEEAA